MRVHDVMSSPAVTVSPATPVNAAARCLADRGFTALPVVDGDGRLLGVVTEADLLVDRFPPDPRLPWPRVRRAAPGAAVADVMDRHVVVAHPEEAAADLVTVLRAAGLRAVPVVHGEAVVGVVTYRDLLRALARDDAAIEADVRRRLDVHYGIGRWRVSVHDAEVTLVDDRPDPAARRDASGIAEAVIGVSAVRVPDIDPAAARSGLRNLEQRARDCGGSLDVRPRRTGGTRLRWRVPLP